MSRESGTGGIQWDSIFSEVTGRLELPEVERCVVLGAASPQKDEAVATDDGDRPARLPQVVVIDEWLTKLRSLEFELDGDLMLQVPRNGTKVDIIVRSPGLARWIALTEGEVASLTAIDSFVGGTTATLTDGGTHFIPVPTRVSQLRLERIEIDGAMVGWVEASRIIVKGPGALHALGSPLDRPVEVRAGALSVESRRIHVDSTLYAGSVGKHTHISCETDETAVVLGETLAPSETRYLTVEGGILRILRGLRNLGQSRRQLCDVVLAFLALSPQFKCAMPDGRYLNPEFRGDVFNPVLATRAASH